jgi:hypothetical protein
LSNKRNADRHSIKKQKLKAMNEFALIFRNDFHPEAGYSPDKLQEIMKQWQVWMGGMAAKGQLANPGTRLGGDGKTIKPSNVVTNGPYAEIKEMITGVIVVKAGDIDEATEIAKGCPILNAGGNVEVRDIVPMGAN